MSRISVLIVGSGAREHALAWKLGRSPEVGDIYVAPGNAGTVQPLAERVPVDATHLDGIVRFVEERDVALTVVGPEAPLALGLADRLGALRRPVFGPNAAAARIESSKSFAKELMARCGVPTAAYAVFDEPDAALRFCETIPYPIVVKADGLAAGKGVTVCADVSQAQDAVRATMMDGVHGAAGRRIVIEEALSGPEVSLFALVEGEHVVPLPVAQDHKRLGDGDTGPNTGGMGAYAPVPFLDDAAVAALTKLVMEPVVAALAAMGTPFRGVLFAGLMLTADGPKVLEFNCRFGDPEAQVILPLLADDLLPWLEAIAAGQGKDLPRQMPVSEEKAVGVVLAARGYPWKPELGWRVNCLPPLRTGGRAEGERVLIFHGGTELDGDGRVITAGGRVLTVVGLGSTIDEAARRAYDAPVCFEGMQRRSDIAWQAMSPHRAAPSLCSPVPPWPDSGEGGLYEAPDAPGDRRGVLHTPARVWASGQFRIGVLASGEGSNLQALLDACAGGEIDGHVAVVVSHRAGARALERARDATVPTFALPLADWRDPDARRVYEGRLLALLGPFELDLLVLAGWMMILSADFLARCSCPMLNVHPALLPMNGEPDPFPALRGAHAVRDALALGLPYTGVSVHHVTAEVDAGPVVLRELVLIEPGDDEQTLYRRIKEVEHRLLPQAVQTVLTSLHVGGVHA